MHPRHEAKFGAYVSASEGLHGVLENLWTIAREAENSHLDVPGLIESFEFRLQEFFRTWEESHLGNASLRLAAIVGEIANSVRGTNPEAGAILDGARTTLEKRIPHWNFENHVRELHDVAKDIARGFFAGCPLLADRLNTNCPCEIKCLESDPASPPMLFSPSARLIEAVFILNGREPHFSWYVALPFRFLHEYTAHVFPIDTKYQMFSDGWMLVAASRFIENRWIAEGERFPLSEKQVYVFSSDIEHRLPPVPHRGARVARLFESFLELEQRPLFFMEVSHALCSLRDVDPKTRLADTARFLRNLERMLPASDGKDYIRGFLGGSGNAFVRAISDR